jgi:hypothetical protein
LICSTKSICCLPLHYTSNSMLLSSLLHSHMCHHIETLVKAALYRTLYRTISLGKVHQITYIWTAVLIESIFPTILVRTFILTGQAEEVIFLHIIITWVLWNCTEIGLLCILVLFSMTQ